MAQGTRRSRGSGKKRKLRRSGLTVSRHLDAPKGSQSSRSSTGRKTRSPSPARQLQDVLKQQAATATILKVIASSPTKVGSTLQTIVESACEFCDAYDANVLLKIGNDLHYSAHHGPIPTGQGPRRLSRQWVPGRSVIDKVPVQFADLLSPEAAVEFPEGQRNAR